ncbi:MAG: hypothetical protein MHM6MM_004570 [Cercozoa sp. M6MM]
MRRLSVARANARAISQRLQEFHLPGRPLPAMSESFDSNWRSILNVPPSDLLREKSKFVSPVEDAAWQSRTPQDFAEYVKTCPRNAQFDSDDLADILKLCRHICSEAWDWAVWHDSALPAAEFRSLLVKVRLPPDAVLRALLDHDITAGARPMEMAASFFVAMSRLSKRKNIEDEYLVMWLKTWDEDSALTHFNNFALFYGVRALREIDWTRLASWLSEKFDLSKRTHVDLLNTLLLHEAAHAHLNRSCYRVSKKRALLDLLRLLQRDKANPVLAFARKGELDSFEGRGRSRLIRRRGRPLHLPLVVSLACLACRDIASLGTVAQATELACAVAAAEVENSEDAKYAGGFFGLELQTQLAQVYRRHLLRTAPQENHEALLAEAATSEYVREMVLKDFGSDEAPAKLQSKLDRSLWRALAVSSRGSAATDFATVESFNSMCSQAPDKRVSLLLRFLANDDVPLNAFYAFDSTEAECPQVEHMDQRHQLVYYIACASVGLQQRNWQRARGNLNLAISQLELLTQSEKNEGSRFLRAAYTVLESYTAVFRRTSDDKKNRDGTFHWCHLLLRTSVLQLQIRRQGYHLWSDAIRDDVRKVMNKLSETQVARLTDNIDASLQHLLNVRSDWSRSYQSRAVLAAFNTLASNLLGSDFCAARSMTVRLLLLRTLAEALPRLETISDGVLERFANDAPVTKLLTDLTDYVNDPSSGWLLLALSCCCLT